MAGMDDPWDELLRRHVTNQLEPQVGRAAQRFRQHRSSQPVERRGAGPVRPLAYGIAMGLIGGALAASVALLWAAPALWPNHFRDAPTGTVAESVYTEVLSRTIDEGPYLVEDDLPVRKLRHQRLQQITWYDAEHDAHVRVVLPREDVTLVEMTTY